jgi:hypothetical protein
MTALCTRISNLGIARMTILVHCIEAGSNFRQGKIKGIVFHGMPEKFSEFNLF